MFHTLKKRIYDYFTEANDLYDATKPIYAFSKLLGYAPHTQKRSSKKLTVSGIFFTIALIVVKCALIYMSYDPNQFLNVTSSDILNYGIWIQTEVSLVLSLWFLLRASTKISNKWTIGEKLIEIDEMLKNEFSVNLCYKDLKLCSTVSAISGATFALTLFGLTVYFLLDLPFNPLQKACVCFSIYVSNVSVYAITTEYIAHISLIFMRFNAVNNLLKQLLLDGSYLNCSVIDESSSKELIYTNYLPVIDHKKNFMKKKSNISSIQMNEWMNRRNHEIAQPHKPPMKLKFLRFWSLYTKVIITKATFYKSSTPSYVLDKLTPLISLHEKLSESIALINDLFSMEFLFILMLIFTYVLFGLFSRYMVVVDYQFEAYKISSLNLTWMTAYTLSTLAVISLSTLLTNRAKQTAVIVHRVIRKTKDFGIQEKLFAFSKILHSRRVALNFGLVQFDWPLLFQLNGAMFSYLIILIQFQWSNKKSQTQQ